MLLVGRPTSGRPDQRSRLNRMKGLPPLQVLLLPSSTNTVCYGRLYVGRSSSSDRCFAYLPCLLVSTSCLHASRLISREPAAFCVTFPWQALRDLRLHLRLRLCLLGARILSKVPACVSSMFSMSVHAVCLLVV